MFFKLKLDLLPQFPQQYYWPSSDYGHSPPLATRAGWMSLAILPFQVLLATKWNFITILTGVSHEHLQPLHRWSGWLMYLLALIHTVGTRGFRTSGSLLNLKRAVSIRHRRSERRVHARTLEVLWRLLDRHRHSCHQHVSNGHVHRGDPKSLLRDLQIVCLLLRSLLHRPS